MSDGRRRSRPRRNYLPPIGTGTPILVRAWVTVNRRRTSSTSAEVSSDGEKGTCFAQAAATVMQMTLKGNQMSELVMHLMETQADADAFRTLNEEQISLWS